jgi:hypothetical protein
LEFKNVLKLELNGLETGGIKFKPPLIVAKFKFSNMGTMKMN